MDSSIFIDWYLKRPHDVRNALFRYLVCVVAKLRVNSISNENFWRTQISTLMKSFLNKLAWLYFTLTLYFYLLNAFLPVSQTEWIEKISNLNVCSRMLVRRILVIFHLTPGKLFQTLFNMSSKLSIYERLKKKNHSIKKNTRRVFSISHIIAIDIKTLTHYKQHTSFWLATFIHDFRAK